MLSRNHPDGIHIAFDDHRLVNNAGLILPATLPSTWACVNSLTVTSTSGMHRGGRTRETRC